MILIIRNPKYYEGNKFIQATAVTILTEARELTMVALHLSPTYSRMKYNFNYLLEEIVILGDDFNAKTQNVDRI